MVEARLGIGVAVPAIEGMAWFPGAATSLPGRRKDGRGRDAGGALVVWRCMGLSLVAMNGCAGRKTAGGGGSVHVKGRRGKAPPSQEMYHVGALKETTGGGAGVPTEGGVGRALPDVPTRCASGRRPEAAWQGPLQGDT